MSVLVGTLMGTGLRALLAGEPELIAEPWPSWLLSGRALAPGRGVVPLTSSDDVREVPRDSELLIDRVSARSRVEDARSRFDETARVVFDQVMAFGTTSPASPTEMPSPPAGYRPPPLDSRAAWAFSSDRPSVRRGGDAQLVLLQSRRYGDALVDRHRREPDLTDLAALPMGAEAKGRLSEAELGARLCRFSSPDTRRR